MNSKEGIVEALTLKVLAKAHEAKADAVRESELWSETAALAGRLVDATADPCDLGLYAYNAMEAALLVSKAVGIEIEMARKAAWKAIIPLVQWAAKLGPDAVPPKKHGTERLTIQIAPTKYTILLQVKNDRRIAKNFVAARDKDDLDKVTSEAMNFLNSLDSSYRLIKVEEVI